MNVPKRGGHRKPGPAARHTPEGYEHMKTCPTCHGKGKVSLSATSVFDLAKRRA